MLYERKSISAFERFVEENINAFERLNLFFVLNKKSQKLQELLSFLPL